MDGRAPQVKSIADLDRNGYSCTAVNRAFSILAALAACTAPVPPPGSAGPVEAVLDFAAALQRGDAAAAYSLLSSRTQREADRLAARARAAAGDAGIAPESGRQMLLGSALPQGKVQARELGRDGPDAARVEVIDSSQHARTWRVIREGSVWKIDLDLGPSEGG